MIITKPKSLYEIAFNERDNLVLELELERAEIASEVEGAMAEYAKIAKRRKVGKIKKKRITGLLLEGDVRIIKK